MELHFFAHDPGHSHAGCYLRVERSGLGFSVVGRVAWARPEGRRRLVRQRRGSAWLALGLVYALCTIRFFPRVQTASKS